MNWVDAFIQGLLLGGLYAQYAIGMALMFGVMRIVNIAHGDLVILLGLIGIAIAALTGAESGLVALLLVPLGAVIGWLLQRGILLAKLIYPSNVRFEIEKFHWLGSLNSETAVTLAWHTASHKTAKDLFAQELIVGGITGVDPETTPRLYNSLIGTKFKVVTGYNSTAQIALAVERGEVQGIADWSWSSVKAVRPNWLADKQATLLMQGALKNEPELGSLPNALDFIKNDADRKVMELHFTQKTAARPLVTPPEVPAERVALLRKAFEALAQDQEFLTEMDKAKMEFAFVPGPEIDKIVAQIAATPPEIAERYAKAFSPEGK